MADQKPEPPKLLKLSCTLTDCDNNLHCFRTNKKLRDAGRDGSCRECGAALVDWDRVRERNIADIDFTFSELQREFIRHHYFCNVQIDERALASARKQGHKELRAAVEKRLRRVIGQAYFAYDGRQTPWSGPNPIPYAQHATASCCRRCVEEWHGIPQGQALTDDQITYLSALAMRFIEQRVQITENGESVPRNRRRTRSMASTK